jgi:hypothetical protein
MTMNLFLKKHLALAATILAIAVAGTGCAGKPSAQPGGARIGIDTSGLAVAADVAKLTVSVDTTPPMSIDLTKASSGLSWSGFLGGIPAGLHVFSAKAYKLGGTTPIYSGSASVTINAGQLAQVVIILQEGPGGTINENVPQITALTASDLNPVPSEQVQLTVVAQDLNTPSQPLTYAWSATCAPAGSNGSFDNAASATPIWTAPPAAATCTLSTTVTNTKGSSVQTFMTLTVTPSTGGSVNVAAYVNTNPVITSLFAKLVYDRAANTQTADFTLLATDPDGDNLAYAWTASAACSGGTFTNTAPYSVSSPHFSLLGAATDCTFTAVVTDLCTAGNCGGAAIPGGKADGAPRGGQVTGVIAAKAPPAALGYPVVSGTTQPVGSQIDAPGATVTLGVFATEPQGGTLAFTWTAPPGGSFVAGSQNDSTSAGTGSSFIQLVAPATLVPAMPVTVTIHSSKSTASLNLDTVYTFHLVPANPCIGKATGAACVSGNLCVQAGTETCDAGGVCGGGTAAVTCSAADACHVAGTCNPNTGTCSNPAATDGTSCSGNSCAPATCAAGVCNAGTAVDCTKQTAATCQTSVGATCNGAGTTPVCSFPSLPATTDCSAGNACAPAACNGAGACVAAAPVTCTTPGTCQAGSGTCSTVAGKATCAYGAASAGAACTGAAPCTTYACDGTANGAAACVGATDCTINSTTCCPGTQTCNGGTKACVPQVPTATASVLFPSASIAATGNQAGDVYLAGSLFGTQTIGATSLTSDGSADVLLAKYSAGAPVWAVHFGGGAAEASSATDQIAVGAAVTQDQTVVVIGSTSGAIVVNGTSVAFPAAPQDFILGVNGATGAGKFAIPVNNGTAGALLAVAANPKLNVFAVCGYTNTISSLAQAGVVAPTGSQATDAVIGVYSSAGTLLWSKQIASPSFEDCSTIAIDDAGDVYVAGKYGTVAASTSINPGLGALPVTGLASRRFIWVAKYSGATGAVIAQAGYGSGNGIQVPTASTVDASGNLILGGKFVSSLPFGAGALTLTGSGTDGFIAKLPVSGTSFAPAWAVRLGGTGNTDLVAGLGTTSFGEVLATGTFALTSTGALTLTSAGGSDDIFLVKLDANTGATQSQQAFGDASAQAGAGVLVNRYGTVNKDLVQFVGTLNGTVAFGGTAGSLSSPTTTGFMVTAPLQ